jgi:nucleoprotein TPR
LNPTETKRQALENELQTLKTKGTGHSDEIKALNGKIETLQSSNRTNLSIIEANNKRDQTISEELTKQHQRNVELSREITTLQQAEQASKGQLSSAKYREDSLQQQLELARRNSEWLETELKNKSDEALKYRKEKGARIAELQRQNEDAKADIEALKRAEQQLRQRLNDMQAKADEALVKLQKQEGSFATTIESYKHELQAQRQLVEMSGQLSQKHQERVRDLEGEKARLKDSHESELHRVRFELEQERQANKEQEEKIFQFEAQIEELRSRPDPVVASVPETPRANGSLAPRASSPFATPGSIRGKSAMTATQALDQAYHFKDELAKERRKNQKLREDIDDMMAALEAKGPEFQDLQAETETLRSEITRMSELSQQSFEERDNSRRAARKAESALSTAQAEVKILRMQVRDLGTQLRMLVFNIYAMEKGMDRLSDEERIRLEQLAKGEITEDDLSDMSDTHHFITERLVVFKDIQSLQKKNEENLATIRQLAEQMDSDEAISAKRQAKEDHDKVEKLEQELSHMTEEATAMKGVVESCKRERDMFRRILQQRGALDESAALRGSFGDSQRLPLTSIESGDQVDVLNEALRKLQTEYDSYRDAQEGVRKEIRAQVDSLTSERSTLQTDKIKLQGEVRLESERREMLQTNFVALQAENTELQKRSQALSEAAAKQDIRTQQVAEELIEAKGLLDSMRNETANLKAEKKLWNDIHERMRKDNESLIEEKNRLNNVISSQQSLENERSISEAEARRKASARIETLERELSDTQKRLSNESDETKKLQLRKEYEGKEAQKRIDDLMSSLSQLREEQVSVKTSRDHLQARVNELTVELRNAEERVGRLQPRPTPRPNAGTESSQRQQELESEISDLNDEISDLKRELDLSKTHLDNAKAQAEQYRELSQANEEALKDVRESQEEYQKEMEALVEEKNSKIQELEGRIEDISSELSRSNTELSTLRDSQGEVTRRYQDEKAILEEELTRLKEDSARHVEAARYHQQDLRAQAEIASKAQHDYEQELVKHADAAKLVQQLRGEYNQLKSETANLRTEAESAKLRLTQSEGSWEDQRQRLEQEIIEIKARREDANAQNKLLHQQLEGLTAQIASLQQNRSSNEDSNEAMSPVAVGDVSEGLRELNGYLRREKEILEVQYGIKTEESKRLQQQLEYTQSQLDEARLKLDQERTQAAQSGRSSMTHQELMEKLNELNLFRESSAALRSENSTLKESLAEKTQAVEALEAKIQPLEAEINTLTTTKEYLEKEIQQIQEDRDRWRDRTENVLKSYGRVDPAEMDELKEKISYLETENATLKESEQPLKDKVAELEAAITTERNDWTTLRGKIEVQFKERSRKLTGEKKEAIQARDQLQEQLTQTTTELENSRKETEAAGAQRLDLEGQITAFRAQVAQLQQEAQAAAQTAEAAPAPAAQQPVEAPAAPAEFVTQLEQQLADARKNLEATNAQKLGAEQQLENLRAEMQTALAERDETIRQLQEAAESVAQAPAQPAPEPAATEEGEVSATQQQPAPQLSDEEKRQLEEKIAAAEAKATEFEAKANEIEARISQTVKDRSDKMKEALNNKLKDSRVSLEDEFKQKEKDLELKFEQEKQIWLAENAATAKSAEPAKTSEQENPSTPGVSSSASAGAPPDLSQLDDDAWRNMITTDPRIKTLITSNVKRRLEQEQAKSAAEVEQKIKDARDQAQFLVEKKTFLQKNMIANTNAKLAVVETASKNTPQKPVVEVWEDVLKLNKPPQQQQQQQQGVASAANTPSKPPAAAAQPAAPESNALAEAAAPATPTPAAQNTLPPNQTPALAKQTGSDAKPEESPFASNPFAASTNSNAGAGVPPNPFLNAGQSGLPAPLKRPSQGSQLPQLPNVPQQQQQQQQGRTGIPMPPQRGGPRGGGRGGPPYQPPGQRTASTGESSLPQPPAGAGRGRGGHGGGRGRGGGNMNPGAADFQPGNKRPRGDSEVGGGAKRARGGAH